MTEVNGAPAFGHAGDSRWSEMLVSYVRAIEYWPYERRSVLRLPDGRRAGMAGAIELFKRLDPEVEAIEVVSPARRWRTFLGLRTADGTRTGDPVRRDARRVK